MADLKTICLRNLCENLKLNYDILKLNKWKIPEAIKDEIYNFFIKYNCKLEETDLEMFTSPIFSISSIELSEKFFKFPEFFLKIPIENLKEINCYINFDWKWLNSFENLIKRVDNIETFKIHFVSNHEDRFSRQIVRKDLRKAVNLLNSPKILDSLIELRIYFSPKKIIDEDILMKFGRLIEKNKYLKFIEFLENEGELILDHFLSLSLHDEDYLQPLNRIINFENLNHLKILSVDFEILNYTNRHCQDIFNDLLPLKWTLEELEILSAKVKLKYVDYVLKNFPILKKFHLSKKALSYKFNFRSINYEDSEGLSVFCLSGYRLSSNDLMTLSRTFERYSKLDQLIINQIDYGNFESEKLPNLINKLPNLSRVVTIHMNVSLNSYEDCAKFARTVSTFKRIDLHLNFRFSLYFDRAILHNLERGLTNINLKKLSFNNILFRYLSIFDLRRFFEKCHFLESVSFSQNLLEDVFDDICLGLLNTTKTLKELKFIDCKLRKRKSPNFEILLRNCECLEVFSIEGNKGLLDENIISALEVSRNTLMELSILYSRDNIERVYQLVQNSMNLRYLSITLTSMDSFDGRMFAKFTKLFKNWILQNPCNSYIWKNPFFTF